MVRYSLYGMSGDRLLGVRSKSRPTAAGAHRFSLIPICVLPADPCTISMHDSLVLAAAAVRANAPAGTIASRNGSATVTPMPLRTVRRDSRFCVRNIYVLSLVLADG